MFRVSNVPNLYLNENKGLPFWNITQFVWHFSNFMTTSQCLDSVFGQKKTGSRALYLERREIKNTLKAFFFVFILLVLDGNYYPKRFVNLWVSECLMDKQVHRGASLLKRKHSSQRDVTYNKQKIINCRLVVWPQQLKAP